ncbi:MAG: DUF5683 domain-containing protein [Flavobacteriales bacterium]|jgi:hypothetical protein
MVRILWLLLTILLFSPTLLCGQYAPAGSTRAAAFRTKVAPVHADSLPQSRFRQKWNMEHSPLRATVYAAVLPGAGQIYNRKYWKLPILYAGMGICVGFIIDNTRQYRTLRDSYIAVADGDPSTKPPLEGTASSLDSEQERFRRYTELSYMALIGVYMLQIIDANVDGHLHYFDVGPNLSLNVHPTLLNTGRVQPALGFTLRL